MPEPIVNAPATGHRLLSLRLSIDEATRVDAAVRAAGRTFAQHARHLLICGHRETRWHEALPFALRHALARIGVNLHQLRKLPADPALHAEIVRVHERLIARLNADLDILYPEAPQTPERPAVRAVRLSAEQRTVIEDLAEASGLSLSAYARAMLLEGKVVVHRSREVKGPDSEMFREQGQALNRVTLAANSDERVPARAAGLVAAIDGLLDAVPGMAP